MVNGLHPPLHILHIAVHKFTGGMPTRPHSKQWSSAVRSKGSSKGKTLPQGTKRSRLATKSSCASTCRPTSRTGTSLSGSIRGRPLSRWVSADSSSTSTPTSPPTARLSGSMPHAYAKLRVHFARRLVDGETGWSLPRPWHARCGHLRPERAQGVDVLLHLCVSTSECATSRQGRASQVPGQTQQRHTPGGMQHGGRRPVLAGRDKAIWLRGYEPRPSACYRAQHPAPRLSTSTSWRCSCRTKNSP